MNLLNELDAAAKYPFLENAKKTIQGVELSNKIAAVALERITKALKSDTSSKVLISEGDKKEWIAAFGAARMILGYLRNSYLTNRFAVSESKMVRSFLDREEEEIVDLVAQCFSILTTKQKDTFNTFILDLPSYLKNSPRSPDYKLINRRLINGKVEIKASEKRRLIEEAVKKYIERIPIVKDPPDIIKESAKKLIDQIPPRIETKITFTISDHPPCVSKLLGAIKKHENLPHQARYYLVAYLLSLNMSEDEITKIYAELPDFSEKITRYQIGHIKKKGYSVASCSTVMTYGLCCAVCKIRNPLNWHKLVPARKEVILHETN